MTITGFAVFLAFMFAMLVGVICYAWGYTDGRDDTYWEAEEYYRGRKSYE